jgi:hypothetical protein
MEWTGANDLNRKNVLPRFVRNERVVLEVSSSASEYLGNLVRRDYEREEDRKCLWLRNELKAGLEARELEFDTLDIDDLIGEARSRRSISPAFVIRASEYTKPFCFSTHSFFG